MNILYHDVFLKGFSCWRYVAIFLGSIETKPEESELYGLSGADPRLQRNCTCSYHSNSSDFFLKFGYLFCLKW